jgi:cytochrome bd-type quinol oxidase subunit 2
MLSRQRRRSARSIVPLLVYLAVFTVILIVVCREYLIPSLQIAKTAGPHERQILAVYARLLLVLLLIILLALLLIALRSGDFLRRRFTANRKPTVYPDAWAEAAKRMKTPSADE